jgi:hypothetical protein
MGLSLDVVRPCRRVRVLEIGHEHLRARVERVDDHLAIDRAGDLDAAVLQVRRNRSDAPVAAAHIRGLGKEVGTLAAVVPLLGGDSARQQLRDASAEALCEILDERERLGREYPIGAFDGWSNCTNRHRFCRLLYEGKTARDRRVARARV